MLRWLVMAATTLLAGCLPLEGAASYSPYSKAAIYCYDPAKRIPYTTTSSHCIGTDRQVTQSEYRQQEADYEARAAAVNAGTVQQAASAAQKPVTPNDSNVYCYNASREIAYGVRAGHCLGTDRQITEQEYSRYQAAHAAADPQTQKSGNSPPLQTSVPERQANSIDPKLKVVASGTGFFIDQSGHVLTNYHVIEGCTQVAVAFGKDVAVTRILAGSTAADLALLETSFQTPLFATFRPSVPEVGESTYVIGYPFLDTLWAINMTSGIVSSLSGPVGYAGVLQTTAPVQPGNSGGPLLDKSGNVIGVVVSSLDEPEAQNVNYAVKVEQVLPFARSAKVALHTGARAGQIETTEIARKGGAYTVPLICLQ